MKVSHVSKALGGGIGAGFLSGFAPALLGFFNLIEPITSHIPFVGPILGMFVGIGTFLVTYFSPKNTPQP